MGIIYTVQFERIGKHGQSTKVIFFTLSLNSLVVFVYQFSKFAMNKKNKKLAIEKLLFFIYLSIQARYFFFKKRKSGRSMHKYGFSVLINALTRHGAKFRS